MTAEKSPQTPGPDPRDEGSAAVAATVLTTVERQLTRYFAAMTKRMDESLAAADAILAETRAEQARQRAAAETYHQALQGALDARLAEFDHRLAVVAAQPVGVSPEELLQIRQAMREDIWRSIAPITERLDALADHLRRSDETTSSLAQHVDRTTTTLVGRIEDGDRRVTADVDERTARIDARITDVDRRITTDVEEHTARIDARITNVDTRAVERSDALAGELAQVDERLNGLIAGATDRLATVERRLDAMHLDLATLSTKVDGIDQDAIEELKSKMSSAIGEAMLVRIELDRVVTSLEERFDKQAVRLGEIEGLLSDHMDVSTAVQLERLDELERAVAMLDPDQFVRKDEILSESSPGAVNSAAPHADTAMHEHGRDGGSGDHFAGVGPDGTSYDDGHSVAASASEWA